jgi:Na+/melibiose symporter-like transporter
LGVGGGLSLGIAGGFGFNPADAVHTAESIVGLKLGFVALPALFAIMGVIFILRAPLDRRRHRIIQRRIEGRLLREGYQTR